MLDFDEKTYLKLLNLAIEKNIVNNCREYPSLVYSGRLDSIQGIQNGLKRKFDDPGLKCGLYIHFPFCRSRCLFCKYYSEVSTSQLEIKKFLIALEKEIESYNIDFKPRPLENLFLGGGTPTISDEENMKRFIGIVHKYFSFKPNAQKTIEGTPESLTLNKLKQYKALGISRISVGLQSSNDHVLKAIGRTHTVKDVFKSFDCIRQAGIKHVGTELIWGLPQESLKSYLKTFDDLISLSPDFIEGYVLTKGGRAKADVYYPTDTNLAELINICKQKLFANGYRLAFEGNFIGFVKNNVLTSEALNQNTDALYRHKASVLGLGPGASSHFSDIKYVIAADYNNYAKKITRGLFPEINSIILSKDDYKRHYIISQIGFFRKIFKKEYQSMFGSEFFQDFPEEVRMLKEKKLISETLEQYSWHLEGSALDQKAFYMHILKYWYSPQYINWIINNILKA